MSRICLKKLLFGLLVFSFGNDVVLAQSAEELMNENRETIKVLKRAYGLNKVEIKVEADGYWYFYLSKAKGIWSTTHGIANQEGKIIIPCDVYSLEYTYLPQMEEGVTLVPCYDKQGNYVRDFSMYHEAANRGFLVKNKIISTDGAIVKELEEGRYSYFNGLIMSGDVSNVACEYRDDRIPSEGEAFISIGGDGVDKDIYTQKGDCLLKAVDSHVVIDEFGNIIFKRYVQNKYVLENVKKKESNIKLNRDLMGTPQGLAELQKVISIETPDELDNKYKKLINETLMRTGAFSLKSHEEIVPCRFADVYYNLPTNEWIVKRKINASYERYSPASTYEEFSYVDIGEALLEQCSYQKVLDYYVEKGANSSWGKYVSALSLRRMAIDGKHITLAKKIIKYLNDDDFFYYEHRDEQYFDLNVPYSELNIGSALLSAYIQEDSTYYENAVKEKMQILREIEEVMSLQIEYEKALDNYAKRKEESIRTTIVEIERQKAEKRVQQTKVLTAVLSVFAVAMMNSSMTPSVSNSSTYTSGLKDSQTTISSSSFNNQKKSWPEWAQKSFKDARNNYEDAKERLHEAEARLIKDETNVLLRQYVDQCRRHVKEWEEKMAEYAAVRE